MHEKNIVTKDDLINIAKNNSDVLNELKGMRENLWKKYHRAKTEEKQTQILAEINDIQPKIKELYKYDKYCKDITKRLKKYKKILIILIKISKKKKTILGLCDLDCLFICIIIVKIIFKLF